MFYRLEHKKSNNVSNCSNEGSSLYVEECSENVYVDLEKRLVTITDGGDAFFTINGTSGENKIEPMTYKFNVVDEGVNVYTYDDLLNCTNRSSEGEIVVLRTTFESLDYILLSCNNI